MGAAVRISRTDHTATGLRAIASRSNDADQTRRLLAIALVLEGATRAEAARQTGMDRQTLRDWVHRFNDEGAEGLVSRKPPGPKPILTSTQLAELHQLVLKGRDPKVHKVRSRPLPRFIEGGAVKPREATAKGGLGLTPKHSTQAQSPGGGDSLLGNDS